MKKLILILLAVIAILILAVIFLGRSLFALSADAERQRSNVEALRDQQRIYKICDSINVAEINALRLDSKQYEKLISDKDKQIQAIKSERKKDVEYYTSLNRIDTITIDNTRIDTIYLPNDTCVGFMDDYVTYLHCKDETLITTNDTIKQIISKHYKHKFLWWKWKVDGFTQDVWSTNPHTNLHFEDFVRVEQ